MNRPLAMTSPESYAPNIEEQQDHPDMQVSPHNFKCRCSVALGSLPPTLHCCKLAPLSMQHEPEGSPQSDMLRGEHEALGR